MERSLLSNPLAPSLSYHGIRLSRPSIDIGGSCTPSLDYYARTCQHFEAMVDRKIKYWVSRDYTLAASLIRLHFHDCAVRGCDGSILLNHWGSERRAKASETLRGFEAIDDIKAEVEKKCPKILSCTDILPAAARDATVKIGGPFWENKYGRKDGRT